MYLGLRSGCLLSSGVGFLVMQAGAAAEDTGRRYVLKRLGVGQCGGPGDEGVPS